VLDAALLLKNEPHIQFVLVGGGKDKAALQASADKRGLSNVTFLPPVAKEGMRGVLAGADACLAILKPLELYKTTYPNKVFDYMAAGRPLVLAIDGVIREVMDQAGAGVFAKPGDPAALAQAVRCLAADPAKARAMGMQGRRYIELHFNRDNLADKLVLLIEEMRGTHA
jgi:glycosyltransferase involved in cell wall biosynthesis